MMNSASLTFHVVFVPGTVQDLRIFIPSLAAWGGGCRFRLVSNGCSPAEEQQLQHLAALAPCFEFYRLPGRGTWRHGRVLSFLQQRETSRYFAFLDSDIFAAGDFLRDLSARSGPVDALFSCPPVWIDDQLMTVQPGFKLAGGPCFQMADGFCIGGSYFAIYDNRLLDDCMKTYGIDLHPYSWNEIPRALRERLEASGRKLMVYDTTKLVNILMNLDGHSCQHVTTPHLFHVGGVSCLVATRYLTQMIRRGVSAIMPRFVRRIVAMAGVRNDWRDVVSPDELRFRYAEVDRREAVCAYLFKLLRTLERGGVDGPGYRSGNPTLDAQVQHMEMIIRRHYPTWRDWIDGRKPIVPFAQSANGPSSEIHRRRAA
jgi:hypothetical protein